MKVKLADDSVVEIESVTELLDIMTIDMELQIATINGLDVIGTWEEIPGLNGKCKFTPEFVE